MLVIQLVVIIISTLFGLLFQSVQCPTKILDSAKLFIFGTLLIDKHWIIAGLFVFIWLREFLRKIQTDPIKLDMPKKNLKNSLPLQQPSKPKIQSLSIDFLESAIEAVQIYDHQTGESQYGILQRTDKSQMAQLGITLKNTILLEKGRVQDSNQVSKLLSQLEGQKKGNGHNLSIQYENNVEYQRNQQRIQKSIPFIIGEFDKQMNEIIQPEILSQSGMENSRAPNQSEHSIIIENILVAVLLGIYLILDLAGGIAQVENIYFQLLDSILFGIIFHSIIQRNQNINWKYILINLSTFIFCSLIFFIGNYFQFQFLIIGCLVAAFQKINPNIPMLILPLILIMKIVII